MRTCLAVWVEVTNAETKIPIHLMAEGFANIPDIMFVTVYYVVLLCMNTEKSTSHDYIESVEYLLQAICVYCNNAMKMVDSMG